jgi:hypothetical protein
MMLEATLGMRPTTSRTKGSRPNGTTRMLEARNGTTMLEALEAMLEATIGTRPAATARIKGSTGQMARRNSR